MFITIPKIIRYLKDPRYRCIINVSLGKYDGLKDEEFLKKSYRMRTGQTLDLNNPIRFNEKIQWLKLYNRQDIFTTMVDKYAVKQFVADLVGQEYVIPLIGVWDNPEEISLDQLPDQFVLKTTHGCGGMFVCKDKKSFDLPKAVSQLKKGLKKNYFLTCREWPYKNVKPRVIAEKFMQNGNSSVLEVYKVFNFSGVPTIIQSIQNDKTKNETIDYFDTSWNLLDLRQNYNNSIHPLPKPKTLDKMLELSAKCSKGFPFLRTDWYEINGQVFFSEFTFFSDAGYELFHPDEWDIKLGNLIDLSLVKTTERL